MDLEYKPGEEERLYLQSGESEVIRPFENVRPGGKASPENLAEVLEGRKPVLYSGSEEIEPDLEGLIGPVRSTVELHLPISALLHGMSGIEERRSNFDLNFYVERDLSEGQKKEIKERLREIEAAEQIRFFYQLGSECDKVFPQQIQALFPGARIDILVKEKSAENVSEAIKLAEKILTISRRRGIGIGYNIPGELVDRELEERLVGDRKKELFWMTRSKKDEKYLELEF